MATTLYTRSYNPIWDFRSLTGLPLDDTSWAYFLENEIPYLPQTVYQDPTGTPWSSPVQLSAAGTLQNIFFDPTKVYRIEIRTNLDNLTPPTQNDPLVWLIEDYIPDGGSVNPPITSGNIASSNQITNPQFSLINFVSPLVLTNQSTSVISVAPGWDLVLDGTAADVTLTRLPLSSTTTPNPTNAPYALELTLSGWTTAYLSQKFEQNGVLWSGKNVTASITARMNLTPQIITGTLVDSMSNLRATVLSGTVTANYAEITGNAPLGASADTNVPPDAFLEYRINLPGSCDISITSLQILATNNAVALTYEQETVERQVDHTFHNYADSILVHPKESFLTGWDFPLNPWQFQSTAMTTLVATGGYVADQTIVIAENSASVQVGKATNGYLQIDSIIGVPQGKIAIIQYIDPKSCASAWDSFLSSLALMNIATSLDSLVHVKARLIYSSTLPDIGITPAPTFISPIASWGATDPVFTSQWTALEPLNDPAYLLTDELKDFAYNRFSTPVLTSDTQTLALVIYTTSAMSQTAVDSLFVRSVSLVLNQIAVAANPLTFDETLRQCQYYYEKSFRLDVFPPVADNIGSIIEITPTIFDNAATQYRANIPALSYQYMSYKRTQTPLLTFYSPQTGTINFTHLSIFSLNTELDGLEVPIGSFTFFESSSSFQMIPIADAHVQVITPNLNATGRFIYHYTSDARLGLVP